MGLIRTALIGGLGYLGYREYQKSKAGGNAAYDKDQPDHPGSDVRDAGPGAMRDKPDNWSQLDEELDESFPSSDPPGNY